MIVGDDGNETDSPDHSDNPEHAGQDDDQQLRDSLSEAATKESGGPEAAGSYAGSTAVPRKRNFSTAIHPQQQWLVPASFDPAKRQGPLTLKSKKEQL